MKNFLDKLHIGSVYKIHYFVNHSIYYSFSEEIDYTGRSFFNSQQPVLFLGAKENLKQGCCIFKFFLSGKIVYVFFSNDYVNDSCLKFVKVEK